ncbi:MAG: YibE/F family protein [Bacillota bacterium]
MRKLLFILSILMTLLLLTSTLISAENPPESLYQDDLIEPVMARAQIIDMMYEETLEYGFVQQVFIAKILSGEFKGEQVLVENTFSGNPAMDMYINPGDKVILAMEVVDNQITAAYPQDFYREFHIYLIIALFILSIIIIGQFKGLKAVITLAITVFLIAKVMLPGMLKGYDPLLLAVGICIVVTTITLLVISGINRKSLAAIVGTTGGVLVAALISIWIGKAAKLTGLSAQEAQMLMYIAENVGFNFKNLLFAGIIIGALGAVMDVSISIASSMEEIRVNNPGITRTKLIRSGMNVGKDIMGTMTNTLILAYTGTSIPLLLLFLAYQQSFLKIINMDFIATEFVRALSGSIGLVLAIPFTALISAALMKKQTKKELL